MLRNPLKRLANLLWTNMTMIVKGIETSGTIKTIYFEKLWNL